MLDRGGGRRFAQEPPSEHLIAGEGRIDQLQRHPPRRRVLSRDVHDAHRAASEHRLDRVAGDARPDDGVRVHDSIILDGGARLREERYLPEGFRPRISAVLTAPRRMASLARRVRRPS